jgi:hypothetical protein
MVSPPFPTIKIRFKKRPSTVVWKTVKRYKKAYAVVIALVNIFLACDFYKRLHAETCRQA